MFNELVDYLFILGVAAVLVAVWIIVERLLEGREWCEFLWFILGGNIGAPLVFLLAMVWWFGVR